jgi:hypothetical protein
MLLVLEAPLPLRHAQQGWLVRTSYPTEASPHFRKRLNQERDCH